MLCSASGSDLVNSIEQQQFCCEKLMEKLMVNEVSKQEMSRSGAVNKIMNSVKILIKNKSVIPAA